MVTFANLLNNHRYCIIFQIPNQNNISLIQLEAFKHPNRQNFSFPDPLINYLLISSSLKAYLKLIQSCKYLYLYKQITIIPNVHLHYKHKNRSYFDDMKVIKLYSNQVSKIWITKQLQIDAYGKANPNALSKFCSKIFKCQARAVEISNQLLTEAEFRFLVQPDFLEALYLCFTYIKKRDGSLMAIEEIVERVPNAQWLVFEALHITYQTFKNLSKLPGKNKLKRFFYCSNREKDHDFHLKFNADSFLHFVTKNAAPNSSFEICFGHSTEATKKVLKIAKCKTKSFSKSWTPQERKPTFFLGANENFQLLEDIYRYDTKWIDDIL